jgi:hypothetical protein
MSALDKKQSNNIYHFPKSDKNEANIGHSGNSDVDVYVNVHVDTRPIAYAMLCSLLATKQITKEEFHDALQHWEQLVEKSNESKGNQKEDRFREWLFGSSKKGR